ncbi:MAG: TolC family protein [Proteobacteria bacterium]|nr:TolC family protein [Pseudomonadota bacterium]
MLQLMIKVVLSAALVCTSFPSLYAREKGDVSVLKHLKNEEPDLYGRMKLVPEGDRHLMEISLGDVLYLVLTRSVTLRTSKLGEKVAEAQLISVQERNRPYVTTKIQQVKSSSVSNTNLDGTKTTYDMSSFPFTENPRPYLSTVETNYTTLSATYAKKNSLGMTFSSVFQNTASQSKSYSMMDKGDDLEGGTPTDDPLESTSLTAGMSVPILQDWGEVNDIPVRRGEMAVEQSRLSTFGTGTSLLETVAKIYWNLVGIRENIRTLEDAVRLSELLANETQARVNVGVLSPTDLKEVRTQLASNSQNLLSTRIQEQEIEDQIRTILNLERFPFGFKPADSPKIHKERFDFESLLKKTMDSHTDLKLLNVSLRSNKYDLDEALNQDKTNLDFDLQYSLSGYGSSTSEAIGNFSKSELQGYQIGLTWSVPLFDKVTPQTIARRKIERSKLELQIQDKKLTLSVNLQTILRNLKFGLEEEKTALLSVNLAKELLDKEVEKLKIGKSTSYNVSQAQQKHTQAKLSEILVRVRNEQNFISLLALSGDFFTYFSLPEII